MIKKFTPKQNEQAWDNFSQYFLPKNYINKLNQIKNEIKASNPPISYEWEKEFLLMFHNFEAELRAHFYFYIDIIEKIFISALEKYEFNKMNKHKNITFGTLCKIALCSDHKKEIEDFVMKSNIFKSFSIEKDLDSIRKLRNQIQHFKFLFNKQLYVHSQRLFYILKYSFSQRFKKYAKSISEYYFKDPVLKLIIEMRFIWLLYTYGTGKDVNIEDYK